MKLLLRLLPRLVDDGCESSGGDGDGDGDGVGDSDGDDDDEEVENGDADADDQSACFRLVRWNRD